MTMDEIRERLAHIIVEKINSGVAMEEIRWNSNLRDDLGIDSLAAAELLFEIEQEFGAPVGTVDARSLLTVRDAVDAIARGLPSSQAA
ncbi:MAG: acyl carrier protein [Polyangia bacterium]